MRPPLLFAGTMALVGFVAPSGVAQADDGAPAERRVELSRLWIDPPDPDQALLVFPYAGHSGVELRGWDNGRFVFRPGLDVAASGYDAYPRLLPEGSRHFGLHLSEEFAAGPMFDRNVDAETLIHRYPATIPEQLIGGYKSFYSDARAAMSGPIGDDRLVYAFELLDTRTTQTYLGANRAETEVRPRYTASFTWQPSPYTRLSLGGRYDAIQTDNYGLSSWVLASAGRNRRLDTATLVATIRHQISPRNEVEATYDVAFAREDSTAAHGVGVPGHYNLDTYQTWGNYGDTSRLRSVDHRLDVHGSTFLDGLLGDADAHTITLGAQLEYQTREQDDSLNGGFLFVDHVPVAASGATADTIDENDRSTWELFSSDRGDELHAKTRQAQIAAYLKDRIQFGSSFSVTPGVRVEHFEGGFQAGATVWRTTTIAPRIGAVWDADLFTTIFADAGRHYQTLDPSMYVRALQGAAYSPLEYWDWRGNVAYAPDPGRDQNCTTPGQNDCWFRSQQFPAAMGRLDDVKHPYVDRLAAGLVRRFDAIGLRAKVRYEYRRYGDMLAITDAAGAYDLKTYALAANPAPKDFVQYYDLKPGSQPRYAITNPANARRETHVLSLAVHQDLARWIALRGSLTWTLDRGNLDSSYGLSTEWRDPSGMLNSYGNMGADRWTGRLGATLDLPLAVRAWVDYTYASGAYYSRVARIQPESLQVPRTYVYDADGRGAHQYPARHLVDLGGSRDVVELGAGRISAWVQVYNLLNASTVTGVREPTAFFNAVRRLEAPREIHLGLRYDL